MHATKDSANFSADEHITLSVAMRHGNKYFKTAVRAAKDELTEQAFLYTTSVRLNLMLIFAAYHIVSTTYIRRSFEDTDLFFFLDGGCSLASSSCTFESFNKVFRLKCSYCLV